MIREKGPLTKKESITWKPLTLKKELQWLIHGAHNETLWK